MISNTKRYKNFIEQTVRQLRKATARKNYDQFLSGVRKFRKYPQLDPPTGPDYGLWYPIHWAIYPSGNLITYEQDGKVYIGPDLSKIELRETSYNRDAVALSKIEDVLDNAFHDRYLSYWMDDLKALFDSVLGPNVPFTFEEYKQNSKLIRGTVPFNQAKDLYMDVFSKVDLNASLAEGQWPKLSNRKIYPMLTIDFNKMEILWNHSKTRDISTYKKALEKVSFDSWVPSYASAAQASRSLISVECSLPGFDFY